MRAIEPEELKRMLDNGEPLQLIDVREPYEAEVCTIGGTLIPMGEILERAGELREDVPVIVHCRSGGRSSAVIEALTRHGKKGLINLNGGILRWIERVDPSLTAY